MILYLLTVCICGCMSMFAQTYKEKHVKPTDESTECNIQHFNKNGVQSIDLSSSETGNLNDIASRISTLVFSLDRDSLNIAPVLDIAFGDSAIYMLDRFASVTKVPFNTEAKSIQFNIRDVFPGDFINPVSIDILNDSLYVLDIADASLLVFDMNFQPTKKIRLRYATVDFSVQDESIMTTNIELPSDPSPFIIYDMNGNIINKLTKDIVYEDIDPNIYCQKAFYKVDGSLYALDGNVNKVYALDGDKLIPKFDFDFGIRTKPESKHLDTSKYVVSTEFFQIRNMTVLSYLFNDERFYCFYDSSTGKIENGTLHQTSDGHAFYPRWQYNGELIGYLPSEDGTGNGSLLFFSLDQY